MRSPLALAEQIKMIRRYLQAMSLSRVEELIPSSWGSDGQLAAPGGKHRYRTGAGFTDAVHSWLDSFPAHIHRNIRLALLLLDANERRAVQSRLVEHQTQEHVAALLGVSTKTISRWERSALDQLAHLLWNDSDEPQELA